jgi:hypothetical protein
VSLPSTGQRERAHLDIQTTVSKDLLLVAKDLVGELWME